MVELLSEADYVELGRAFFELAAQDSVSFAEVDFAAKGKGKPKQCVKGFACGSGCVAKTKTCANPLTGQAKTYAGWLKLQVEAGAKLSDSQQKDADGMGLTKAAKPTKAKKPKASKPDPQGIPTIPDTLEGMESYTRAWQKDRGYLQKPPSVFFDLHDISHGLAYAAGGKTPQQINEEFGYPGRKYKKQPHYAEELYVKVAETAFLEGSTREKVIETVRRDLLVGAYEQTLSLYPGGLPERDFYAHPDRLKDVGRMYDELIANAPPKVKTLLKESNERQYEPVGSVISGKPRFKIRSDSAITKILKAEAQAKGKQNISAFAEYVLNPAERLIVAELRQENQSNDAITAVLVRRQVSIDNTFGKRQNRDELTSQKLAALEA